VARSGSAKVSNADTIYAAFTIAAAAVLATLVWLDFSFYKSQSFGAFAFDPSGYAVGRDFLNTWMSGRSAFSGGPAAWFDYPAYNAAPQAVTGHAHYPLHFWSYPPDLVLFTWPLGLLPFPAAYVLWCVGGLALYVWAARSAGVDRRHLLFLAVAPGVAVNVFYGQNGFLTAALLIGGLTQLDRRPILAGILFGILTIKPQLGMLLPVVLIMTWRWRTIAAASLTAAVLAAATALWFGPHIWVDYFRKVTPQEHWLLIQAGNSGWTFVSSVFVNARLAGLNDAWAWAMQGLASAGALAAIVWCFWRPRDTVLSLALLVTAIFLFSPYTLSYDLVIFGFVVARLRERSNNTAIDHALILAVWTLPLAMMPLGAMHIPVAPAVLAAFAGRLVWRLARGESTHPAGDRAPAVAASPCVAAIAAQ
jgi:alpha-1,2-mannosyltransferase